MLINAGIVRVVYSGDYPDDFSASMLEEAGIEVVRITSSNDSNSQEAKESVRG
jgi:dCMP deaminase